MTIPNTWENKEWFNPSISNASAMSCAVASGISFNKPHLEDSNLLVQHVGQAIQRPGWPRRTEAATEAAYDRRVNNHHNTFIIIISG